MDILAVKKGTTLATKVYRKPTHMADISASNLIIRRM
jgi:hypothetical protein